MRQRSVRKRPHVSPEAILQTALEILDSEGFEGVTFRAIASRLGIQAPALYWHFENKRDLLDDLAQTILAEGGVDAIRAPANAGAWKEWLGQSARTLRTAVTAHRDGGRVVAGASFFRAKALAQWAFTSTKVLKDAGFGTAEAVLASGCVVDYVWGYVIEEQAGRGPDPSGSVASRANKILGPRAGLLMKDHGEDPTTALPLREITDELNKFSEAQLFEWGLQAILEGLAAAKKSGRRVHSSP